MNPPNTHQNRPIRRCARLALVLALVLEFAPFHIHVLVLILLLPLVVLAHVLVFGLIVLHLLVFLLDHTVRRRLGHRRGRPAEVEGSWRRERARGFGPSHALSDSTCSHNSIAGLCLVLNPIVLD
jgi:hypothetical protein